MGCLHQHSQLFSFPGCTCWPTRKHISRPFSQISFGGFSWELSPLESGHVAHSQIWKQQIPVLYPSIFPGGTVGKEPTCQCLRCKRLGSIPGLGRSPGGGHGNLLQYSCLKKPMDIGAWWATVHKVARSWTRLKCLSTHALTGNYIQYLVITYNGK